MDFITTDKVKLNYDDVGNGTPIVILTGVGGSRKLWLSQVKMLVKTGYRVITIDARNQGASDHTTLGRRIARHATDMHELMTKLKLDDIILIGNSMGASTIFAYMNLFSDLKIKAIVDVDQSPKMVNDATWQYGFNGLTWDNLVEWTYQPLHGATVQRLNDETYAAVKAVAQTNPYDVELNQPFLFDHAGQDWRDVIHNLKIPFLVVAGGSSPFFNPKFAKITAAMAQYGESTVIDNSGHVVMAEQPTEFNRVLLNFLNQH